MYICMYARARVCVMHVPQPLTGRLTVFCD